MSTLGDAADVKFGNFGKFQETERFLIPCPRHVSSRLPPSGKTCKYATAPSTQKNKFGEILYLLMCSFLLFLSWLLRSWVRKFRRDLWITLYMLLITSSVDVLTRLSCERYRVHIPTRTLTTLTSIWFVHATKFRRNVSHDATITSSLFQFLIRLLSGNWRYVYVGCWKSR